MNANEYVFVYNLNWVFCFGCVKLNPLNYANEIVVKVVFFEFDIYEKTEVIALLSESE